MLLQDENNVKVHITNYFDTFIEVVEDTKAFYGTKPATLPITYYLLPITYYLLPITLLMYG